MKSVKQRGNREVSNAENVLGTPNPNSSGAEPRRKGEMMQKEMPGLPAHWGPRSVVPWPRQLPLGPVAPSM